MGSTPATLVIVAMHTECVDHMKGGQSSSQVHSRWNRRGTARLRRVPTKGKFQDSNT